MSICARCHHVSFYIEISVCKELGNTHAKFIDECDFYPSMVGKIHHKNECPHFIDRCKDDDKTEENDDSKVQSDGNDEEEDTGG